MRQTSQRTKLSVLLQTKDLEGRRNDHLLLFVIWGRDALKRLEPLQGILSPLGLVWGHSTNLAMKQGYIL